VILQAERFLQSHNLKLDEFERPQARYNTNTQEWGVTFSSKSHVIEGDAFVSIDEKTGKIGGLYGLLPLE
jgi:hypothetical protein